MKDSVYSARKLKSLLGHYFAYATSLGVCQQLPRERGKQRKFKLLLDEMPSRAEFSMMLDEHFAKPLEDIVSNSYDEIEGLGNEIREWYDNLPENLQCSSKGEELEECADTLEYIEAAYLGAVFPSKLKELKLSVIPTPDISSRNDRLGEAVAALELVKVHLESVLDDQDEDDPEFTEEEVDAIQEVVEGLEESIDGAQDVCFPSMY